jgi:hypothetical protein
MPVALGSGDDMRLLSEMLREVSPRGFGDVMGCWHDVFLLRHRNSAGRWLFAVDGKIRSLGTNLSVSPLAVRCKISACPSHACDSQLGN